MNTFAESNAPIEEGPFLDGFFTEGTASPYHILNDPDYAFEKFDLDILERKTNTNTEPELAEVEVSNCNHNKRTRRPESFTAEIDNTYDELVQNLDDVPAEEILETIAYRYMTDRDNVAFSGYRAIEPEECDEEHTIDPIYNHLNTIYDEENIRYVNSNYYVY
ncbi:MAG: hypothetical protein OXK80_07050 [Bdellovibrionales bacterium]|nr:hypothetical protein [Bdellovibrionales bacterium]